MVTVYKEGKHPQVGWVHRYNDDLLILQTTAGKKEYQMSEISIKTHPILTIINKIYTWISN
jgi:hypothetical protein